MVKLLLTLATVALVATSALAAEDEATNKARVHLRAGIADYDEGRYAEAASEMEQAYAIRPLADLQYNLAQCYERLNRLQDAAKAYEVYLAGRANAPDREQVQKRIENLRERAQALAEGHAPVAPKAEEKVVFKTIVVYKEVPPPPGRTARWAAYGLGALGAVALGAGIAFAVLTSKASSDVTNGGKLGSPPVFDASRQDAAQLYPIGTGVGFGVAGLAVGGAVGLGLAARKLDRDAQRQREGQEARIPVLAPFYVRVGAATVGGVSIAGAF